MDLITEPGVYDLPEDVYHADPVEGGSLSSTGARRLLAPSCPAKFRWLADHPEHKDEFDFGKAAHHKVLGVGAEIVVVDADSWRTNAAKAAKADAHAEGNIPLLAKDAAIVDDMAAALLADPYAAALFAPGAGRPEQTLVWRDRRTGIMRRALLDYLPYDTAGRMLLADYKTCASAEQAKIEKAVEDRGYHMQGDFYLDGVFELELATSAAFLLVFQEKTPPYVVTVAQIHPETLAIGAVKNAKAIEVYRRCVETDTWPGYSDKPVLTRIPPWAEIQFERARERGDYAVKELVH
jgi:hypothetical protein